MPHDALVDLLLHRDQMIKHLRSEARDQSRAIEKRNLEIVRRESSQDGTPNADWLVERKGKFVKLGGTAKLTPRGLGLPTRCGHAVSDGVYGAVGTERPTNGFRRTNTNTSILALGWVLVFLLRAFGCRSAVDRAGARAAWSA
jgi:hypothetical protein